MTQSSDKTSNVLYLYEFEYSVSRHVIDFGFKMNDNVWRDCWINVQVACRPGDQNINCITRGNRTGIFASSYYI